MRQVQTIEIDGIRMLVFDNEVFDWGLAEEDFQKAKVASNNDPETKANFIADIQKHLLNSLKEFLGREITLSELNQAIKEGWV